MYIYYDKQGILKEVITDEIIREGDNLTDTFYICFENDQEADGIYVLDTGSTDKSYNLLKKLGVKDSKKMTDDKIKRCAPILMKKIPYVTFTLSNTKYNELSSKGFNMNKIKAILHNKVLYELSNKGIPYHKIIVDQFTTPRSYFSYLKQENIDYALLPIDGSYTMSPEEATKAAIAMNPKHMIPMHMKPGVLIDIKQAMKVTAPMAMLMRPNQEIELEK